MIRNEELNKLSEALIHIDNDRFYEARQNISEVLATLRKARDKEQDKATESLKRHLAKQTQDY